MSSPAGDGDGSGVEDDGWNDAGDSNDEDLQRQRMKSNVILSSVCGTLSFIGSSLILFSIYRTRVLSFRSTKQQQQQQQLPSFADNHKNNNDVAKESRTTDDPPPLRYSRWTAPPPPPSPRQLPRQQQLPNGTFQRLLIGTATFDILFSFGWAFGPIPIPSSTGAYGAHGNQTTCTIQSLLLQFGTTFIRIQYLSHDLLRISDLWRRQWQQQQQQEQQHTCPTVRTVDASVLYWIS